MLEVERISKRFAATQALDGVTFRAADGEIVGLLGPNGAGKTTLVSIISGLVRPDDGRIIIAGHDLAKAGSAARRHLGVAAQDVALVQSLTVRQNLSFFGGMARRRGPAFERRIDELVTDFDLGAFVDRQVLLLSGGQQRRAHVACALVGEGDVLLLDEPTAGADLEAQEQILKRISAEASAGRTILYTSHAMDEITALGARVVIIDGGRVIADSTVPELLAQHTRAAVEVHFAHAIRRKAPNAQTTIDGHVVRVTTDDPAKAIGALLKWSNGNEIVNVEVIRPGLAAAFVALTGRQFDAEVA